MHEKIFRINWTEVNCAVLLNWNWPDWTSQKPLHLKIFLLIQEHLKVELDSLFLILGTAVGKNLNTRSTNALVLEV